MNDFLLGLVRRAVGVDTGPVLRPPASAFPPAPGNPPVAEIFIEEVGSPRDASSAFEATAVHEHPEPRPPGSSKTPLVGEPPASVAADEPGPPSGAPRPRPKPARPEVRAVEEDRSPGALPKRQPRASVPTPEHGPGGTAVAPPAAPLERTEPRAAPSAWSPEAPEEGPPAGPSRQAEPPPAAPPRREPSGLERPPAAQQLHGPPLAAPQPPASVSPPPPAVRAAPPPRSRPATPPAREEGEESVGPPEPPTSPPPITQLQVPPVAAPEPAPLVTLRSDPIGPPVEVRIGRVELRPLPASSTPTARSERPRPRGFAEHALARAYVDRVWWRR